MLRGSYTLYLETFFRAPINIARKIPERGSPIFSFLESIKFWNIPAQNMDREFFSARKFRNA